MITYFRVHHLGRRGDGPRTERVKLCVFFAMLLKIVAPTYMLYARYVQHIFYILYSARALVKKTQEPGIKLQKADFFRNDTWTSPQTNAEESPKIPLVHVC